MDDELRMEYLNPPEIQVLDGCYTELDTKWNRGAAHEDPFSCLYMVEQGSGVLIAEGQEIVMKPGFAYLIPTETRFSYRCDGRLVKLFFHLSILGVDGLDILRDLQEIHSVPMEEGELDGLRQLYQGELFAQSIEFRYRLYRIVARLLHTYPDGLMRSRTYSAMVNGAMRRIQKKLSYKLSGGDVAKSLSVAEVTLRQHFKKEMGITPRQYIEDLVMFRAGLLLKTTHLRVKQISDQLGFYDQFYFSRRFAAHYGVPPREYRQQEKRV